MFAARCQLCCQVQPGRSGQVKKTVLITGASRGLGAALVAVFASAGYNLILTSRDMNIKEREGVKIVRGDIKFYNTFVSLVEAADELGVDVLINNAGEYMSKHFDEMTEEDFKEIITVNLIRPMVLTRILWPVLKERGGMVVNINSVAGKVGSDGEVAYCASKHGLRGFASALQHDGVRDGVKVLSVFLGAMRTSMTKHRPDYKKLMNPAEVAMTIKGLCDDLSDHPSLRVTEVELHRMKYDAAAR